MNEQMTPRQAREIFVDSSGDVFDYEDERSTSSWPFPFPPEPEDVALARWQRKQDQWEQSPAGQAQIAAQREEAARVERLARRTDAWAAHRAFAHLGIEPTTCSIRWWGDPSKTGRGHIDVHIPGRFAVRVQPDGTCSGGERR